MLFASGEPVSATRLGEVLGLDESAVTEYCMRLADKIDDAGSALQIVRTEDKFQLCTRAKYASYIRAALELRKNTPLSPAAMEVLAIIAYNEPVTRNLVERVRGVDCSGVISSLLNKGLIEEKGRLDLPGRPMQYKTSTLFLRCFGMESLSQLPRLPGDEEELDGQITVDDVLAGKLTSVDEALLELDMAQTAEDDEDSE